MYKFLALLACGGWFLCTPVFAEQTLAEPHQAAQPLVQIYDIGQTVLKISLKEGITRDQAIESMLSKAAELNIKMVGRLAVSQEVQARGIDARYLEIFQFCNPEDAIKMVAFDPIYAAYMPCRIALVEDKDGKYWLMSLNMDLLIDKFPLPEKLRRIAITINGAILQIMTAASTGDF